MNLTVPLVPKWLPPSQEFWAYATGIGHIAAGVAILTGVQARLAAILLTVMFASFTPLVHVPMLLADPSSHFMNWTENALNLALTGAAWVVADSLARPLDARVFDGSYGRARARRSNFGWCGFGHPLDSARGRLLARLHASERIADDLGGIAVKAGVDF
jgi:hypothetical protein